MVDSDKVYINGIDAATGEYLVAPLTYSQAVTYIRGEPYDTPLIRFLKAIWNVISQPHLGLPAGRVLARAGDTGRRGTGAKDRTLRVGDALATLRTVRR